MEWNKVKRKISAYKGEKSVAGHFYRRDENASLKMTSYDGRNNSAEGN
jgi:hypothetical protein